MAILAEPRDLGDQHLIITQTRSVELLEPTETMELTDWQLATDYDLLLDDYCSKGDTSDRIATAMGCQTEPWSVYTPRVLFFMLCQASTANIDVETSFSLKRAIG